MQVTDNNKGCLNINNHEYPCTFGVNGDKLIVYLDEGKGPTSIEVQFWHKGMWMGGDGMPHDIWIGPE